MESDQNEHLLNQYKPLVKSVAKDYYLTGGDIEDLIQEGMIGLYKAIVDFNPQKSPHFGVFAKMCITRQIQSAIKAASRKKHMPLNNSLPLSTEEDAKMASSPEEFVLGVESFENIYAIISQALSPLEYNVLMQYIDGKTHMEIAQGLDINLKTVDNAIQRIRRKLTKSLG